MTIQQSLHPTTTQVVHTLVTWKMLCKSHLLQSSCTAGMHTSHTFDEHSGSGTKGITRHLCSLSNWSLLAPNWVLVACVQPPSTTKASCATSVTQSNSNLRHPNSNRLHPALVPECTRMHLHEDPLCHTGSQTRHTYPTANMHVHTQQTIQPLM